MDWLKKLKINRDQPEVNPVLLQLETPQEKKERWRSIYIIYFTTFLMTLGFSIILTGVWPYLDKLDPEAGKEFMGLIVAANPFGQMIFSPLVGWWSNRLPTIHLPLLLSIGLFSLASAWYSILEVFTSYRKYWMLVARLLVGISSANVAVCRSYLSAATMLHERTQAVSMVSFAQVLGFIVGPGIQAAVTPLGNDGYPMGPYLTLNMYTAAGWVNVVLGLFNLLLFLPMVFKERKIAAREAMVLQNAASEKATWKGKPPDYISLWTLIVAFFVLTFNFVLLETLATSLTMDQFAWNKEDSLYYMGILMSAGGVVACFTFASISPLCKLMSEQKLMVWGGFFLMVLGRAVCIPWGSEPPLIAYPVNSSLAGSSNMTEVLGCPSSQEWCLYTPAMTLAQFILGYTLTAMGYPIGITLIQTIYSKALGPRPQGTWMGWLTGSGCMSRVMGPIFIGVIYTRLGTIWTFSLTTAMMAVALVWLVFMDRRLQDATERHSKAEMTLPAPETVGLVPLEGHR